MLRFAQRSTFVVRCLLFTAIGLLLLSVRTGLAWPPNPDPVIDIEAVKYVGEGPGASITISVKLTKKSAETISVQFETKPNTAEPNTESTKKDYEHQADTLTFLPDEDLKTITIPITNDAIEESLKSFYVDLSNPSGGAATIGNARCEVTIIDDDGALPTVQFELGEYSPGENGGSLTVWVSLSALAPVDVSVKYQTKDGAAADPALGGADFEICSATLTWAVGDTASKAIVIPIFNDTAPENTETFTVQLSNFVGAASGIPSVTTVSIGDDDPPPSGGIVVVTATDGMFTPDPWSLNTWLSAKLTAKAVPPVPPLPATLDGDPTWTWTLVSAQNSYDSDTGPWTDASGSGYQYYFADAPSDPPDSPDDSAVILWASFPSGGYWHLGVNTQVDYTDTDSSPYRGAQFVRARTSNKFPELNFEGNKYEKNGPKAFVVYVNNYLVDPQIPDKFAHLDDVVNGDTKQLAKLNIKPMNFLIPGDTITLKVSDKTKIRIFDETNKARIGPPAADGGPDADSYNIPTIGAAGLTYLVECVDHGNVKIELILARATPPSVCSDYVNAVMVVDRVPGNKQGTDQAIRFRVRGSVDLANVDAIEATISTPTAPKSNYAAPRTEARSLIWIGAQTPVDPANPEPWFQSGFFAVNDDDPMMAQGVYIEVKVPEEGRYIKREYVSWPKKAKLKIGVTNAANGTVEATLDLFDGNGPKLPNMDFSMAFDTYKTKKLPNYQIGSELFQSNDQNPGSSDSDEAGCTISDASVWVNGVRQDTAFTNTNVRVRDWTTRGVPFSSDGSHFEWGFSNVIPRGFRMWDKMVEY